jgi:hypothetical protein
MGSATGHAIAGLPRQHHEWNGGQVVLSGRGCPGTHGKVDD